MQVQATLSIRSTESDATHATMRVSRGSRSYDVYLVLKQENGAWKIISADEIQEGSYLTRKETHHVYHHNDVAIRDESDQ